ncbi:hypothetical protein BBBOND_0405240 [Babesia bigemina]|uniref:Uncharacterized protein n=1 Tax=Babesia bigemina TaxID=5866 RepID=A0A061DEX5_BABBI|nr:hypothetical protein BBBOND_0405240 [Babesia bigemina]CDR98040.1 hypothetical protein BBBOND_0405240 [Babesia bigemina]|eukprot:XP_012770226.1 hypothetical protein BBBOND_0405240 [Babesia bigemina]
MTFHSLTTTPRNVKDAIDWLVALKGTNAFGNLKAFGAAIHKVLSEHPVGFKVYPSIEDGKIFTKRFLEQEALKDQPFIQELLERYNKPLDKQPSTFSKLFGLVKECDFQNVVQARHTSPADITTDVRKLVDGCENFLKKVQHSDKYRSTYSPKATWDSSCASYPEGCAKVFVGIAPMLYAGLRALKESGADAASKGPKSKAAAHLEEVMSAMGYEESRLRPKLGASDIVTALRGINGHALDAIYDFAGFWAFY